MQDPSGVGRLDSWKEIAAHLHRGVTTVQRWEREEALPVHRLPHTRGDSVYAWREELDGWWQARSHRLAGSEHRRPRGPARLLVLPFDNLGGDPAQDCVAGGLTEELITRLARRLPGDLAVIARTTATVCKASGQSIREMAEELDLEYVVEGSVRRSADQVRIAVQLIDARSETHLWAETRELPLGDLLTLQSEVAEAVAAEVTSATSGTPGSWLPSRRIAGAAYDAYLKGLHLLWSEVTESGFRRCVSLFRKALEIEPQFAPAYVGLSHAYQNLGAAGINAQPPAEVMPPAREAARRALELDDSLGRAHTALGVILWQYDWSWAEALKQLRLGVQLNPSHAMGHAWLALCQAALGHHVEASVAIRRARDLDPHSPLIQSLLVCVLAESGLLDDAENELRSSEESFPEHWLLLFGSALVSVVRGDHRRAFETLRRAGQLCPSNSNVLSWLGHCAGRAGQREEAARVLQILDEAGRTRYVPAWSVGNVHAGLGEFDKAFECLERAFEERSGWLVGLRSPHLFGMLRSDPRHEGLCRRVGL